MARFFCCFIVIFSFVVMTNRIYALPLPQPDQGYIYDVQAERKQQFYEIFLISPSPSKKEALKDVIFNQQLSAEFKIKYREKFGQLDSESITYQPSRFSFLNEKRGLIKNGETDHDKRRAFGEYMVKRLSEWHIDNYFKTDPNMRPVYELKEKLSNVEVQVTKETKVNIQYSLSSNEADLVVDNPYFENAKLTLMMNTKQFGPGPIEEQKLILEKQLTTRLRLNNSATQKDGIVKSELFWFFKFGWTVSTGFSAAFKKGEPSPRETVYLAGLTRSW